MLIKKRYFFSLLLIVSLLILSCSNDADQDIKADYILESDGEIYYEVFDTQNVEGSRFTSNNSVYKGAYLYTYEYKHLQPDGEVWSYYRNVLTDDWGLISTKDSSIFRVNTVDMYVLEEMGLFSNDPYYYQSVIDYRYFSENGQYLNSEQTGLIENEKNIWMHPPRDGYFSILELNPFPFIQAPVEIGNKWTWHLIVGGHYGSDKWREWNGNISIESNYEITGFEWIDSKLGPKQCVVTTAIATSKLGKTKLISYFNYELGFIRLDYTNIDSSKTIIELASRLNFSKE